MYIRVGTYKENKPYHLQLAPRTLPIWDAHPSMNPKNNPTQIVVHYFIVGYLLHFSRKCVCVFGGHHHCFSTDIIQIKQKYLRVLISPIFSGLIWGFWGGFFKIEASPKITWGENGTDTAPAFITRRSIKAPVTLPTTLPAITPMASLVGVGDVAGALKRVKSWVIQ